MFSLFRKLMPKEEKFFDMYARHAEVVERGARGLRAALEGGPDTATRCAEVEAAEKEADQITREVTDAVRRSFVTPFDRGDIQSLIARMDDTIDQMKKTAKAIRLFGMEQFASDYRGMGDCIVRCAEQLRKAVPLMEAMGTNHSRITVHCRDIARTESEADGIHDSAVRELYRRHSGGDALKFISEREILDHLERVVDLFEDAAQEIENILVEHL